MSYFDYDRPNSILLNETLENLTKIIYGFYKEEQNKEDNVIRLHQSTLGADELMAFNETFLSGNFTMGSINKQYETNYANLVGSSFCHTCNSGSSANLLVISTLLALGRLKPGDHVAVPALAWSTTIFPLIQYGLIPVFFDADKNDFNINLDQLTNYCKVNNNIKAIFVIHTYGNPADIDRLKELKEEFNLIILEDTCESMGSTWNDKHTGTFGLVGTYSTYFSHHISTLEGGLIVTDDPEISEVIQSIRSHGWLRHKSVKELIGKYPGYDPSFLFEHVGYNLRLSEPQAAIGIEQLKKLDSIVNARIGNANKYNSLIEQYNLSKYIRIQKVYPNSKSSWFGFPIFLPDKTPQQVATIRNYLKETGIENRPFLCGDFSSQPVMNKVKYLQAPDLSFAKQLHTNSFALPCHNGLSEKQLEYVVDKLSYSITRLL